MRGRLGKIWLVCGYIVFAMHGCGIDPIPFPGPTGSTPIYEDASYSSGDAMSVADVMQPDDSQNPSSETMWRLKNASSASVWLQQGSSNGNPTWYALIDSSGNSLAIHDDCGVSNCDDPDAGVCGISWATVIELKPGAIQEVEWDRTIWVTDAQCETNEAVTEVEYTGRFCWGLATLAADSGDFVDEVHCEDQVFQRTDTLTSITYTILD